ncbi:ORF I: Movement protein [Bienertia sinuspersici]
MLKKKLTEVLSKASNPNKHPVQKKIIYEKDDPLNQELPLISKNDIYAKSKWDFVYGRGIQIEEFTTSVSESQMSIQLLDKDLNQKYISEGFRYVHFGCVQIAIKPLVRLVIDVPVMLALRDKSLISFKDSLLALANSHICQGAIYFNCFPNLCNDLEDPYILQSLTLYINLSKEIQFVGARNFSVIYRVYYQLLNTQLNPRCKIHFALG